MKMPSKVSVLILQLTLITYSFGQSSTQDAVIKIVNEIATTNRYDESFTIGIGGILSKQYQLFEQLAQIATPQQLVDLTTHKNAVVRLYAFQALRGKMDHIPEKILRQFQNDQSIITVMRGCIMQQQSMNNLVAYKLNSWIQSSN